ncbi:MAG: hypothetical protein HC884_15325 [Chloroflexaceae bacterium]|nr:hypothetical protein [Chloroflexaceae bacterium]
MSGPKSGWIIVAGGSAIVSLVIAWRSHQEQQRKVRAAQSLDMQRERDVSRAAASVSALLHEIEAQCKQIHHEHATAYAAEDLRTWEQQIEGVRTDFARLMDKLDQARQQFQATSESTQQTGQYDGGFFDSIDFGILRHRLSTLQDEGIRIISTINVRQEAERLNQELTEQRRQAAESQIALLEFQGALQVLASLPHTVFAPGSYASLEQRATRIIAEIERGAFQDAIILAHTLQQEGIRQTDAVRASFAKWQQHHDQAAEAMRITRENLISADQTLLEHYAPKQYAEIQQQIEALEHSFEAIQSPTHDLTLYETLIAQSVVIRETIVQLQTTAVEDDAKAKQRREVVREVVRALEGMNFNVGVRLADKNDPFSDFLVAAGRPSGQEWSLRVDYEQHIHMETEDGTHGADCVKDVKDLQQRLEGVGVHLNMTDWGRANPNRPKPGNGAEKDKEEKKNYLSPGVNP